MTEKEKLSMLEDLLEMEEGTLCKEQELSELAEWDSVNRLSFIVMLDNEFGKEVSGEMIIGLAKVEDLLNLME